MKKKRHAEIGSNAAANQSGKSIIGAMFVHRTRKKNHHKPIEHHHQHFAGRSFWWGGFRETRKGRLRISIAEQTKL